MSIFCCNFAANLFYMDNKPIKTPNGWIRPLDPIRHHKERNWDYKGRGIYHITLVVAEHYPLFGHLAGEKPENAYIELNEYGRLVLERLLETPRMYEEKGYALKILATQVMPDHIHLVIQATDQLPRSIGTVIRGFKSACTSIYKREYCCPNDGTKVHREGCRNDGTKMHGEGCRNDATKMHREGCRNDATKMHGGEESIVQFSRIFTRTGTIWEQTPAHYHERILHKDVSLQAMIDYVHDNPRRRAIKRANPELFRVQEDIAHCGIKMRVMGNRFLLGYPQKEVLRCSRSMTQEEIGNRKAACLEEAAMGTVFVSAAISEGEKQICRAIREAGYPMIVLLVEGFPKPESPHYAYYKPSGVYFAACAEGRLLLLEVDEEAFEMPEIIERVTAKIGDVPRETKRWRFMALNEIAERLSQ